MEHRNRLHKLSRRQILGLLASGSLPLLGACGGKSAGVLTPTAVPMSGSPVASVPGYDDPNRWAGRVLRVAAYGGEIQAALQAMIWQPFEVLTGARIQPFTTDITTLTSSYENGDEPYTDVLLVDAFWAYDALTKDFVEPIPDGRLDPGRV